MESTTTDLSWLCLVAVMVIMIPVIYFGITSRLNYGKQIFDAQAKGAFADLNTPKAKSRTRRLALIALIGQIGMILFFVIFFVQRANGILVFSGVTISVAFVFGITAAIAGLLMKRDIDRRL